MARWGLPAVCRALLCAAICAPFVAVPLYSVPKKSASEGRRLVIMPAVVAKDNDSAAPFIAELNGRIEKGAQGNDNFRIVPPLGAQYEEYQVRSRKRKADIAELASDLGKSGGNELVMHVAVEADDKTQQQNVRVLLVDIYSGKVIAEKQQAFAATELDKKTAKAFTVTFLQDASSAVNNLPPVTAEDKQKLVGKSAPATPSAARALLFIGGTLPLQYSLQSGTALTPTGSKPLGNLVGYGAELGYARENTFFKQFVLGASAGFARMTASADINNSAGTTVKAGESFTANEVFGRAFFGYNFHLGKVFSLMPLVGFNGGYARVTDSSGAQVINGFIPGAEAGLWLGLNFQKMYVGVHATSAARFFQGGDMYLQNMVTVAVGVKL